MLNLVDRLNHYKQQISPYNATLVAVSKTKPIEDIKLAYAVGHRDFGENKVQELVAKYDLLPKDIQWHMIGHLQRNKVKYIVPFVHLIHGVDSQKLLDEIEKEAKKIDRKVNVLLQMHIAKEETKFGFDEDEINVFAKNFASLHYQNVTICGLMGMATFTQDEDMINREFASLKNQFDQLKPFFDSDFKILSMGMSNDYHLALQNGATHIRIGSAIFGERNITKPS